MSIHQTKKKMAISKIVTDASGSTKHGFATDLRTGKSVFMSRAIIDKWAITADDEAEVFFGWVIETENPDMADRLTAFICFEDDEEEDVEPELPNLEDKVVEGDDFPPFDLIMPYQTWRDEVLAKAAGDGGEAKVLRSLLDLGGTADREAVEDRAKFEYGMNRASVSPCLSYLRNKGLINYTKTSVYLTIPVGRPEPQRNRKRKEVE